MGLEGLVGQTIENKYRLRGRLGGGNFGTVFLADELLNGSAVREVAIKIYSPEATQQGDVEGMFEDCALPMRVMSSAPENIRRHFVPIYNWGILNASIGSCAFVSMELVRGAKTLEDSINQNKNYHIHPDEKEVLELMKQFFPALAVAHRAGVLHRDIKGANVMLREGVVKIVDFGMGARMGKSVPLKTTLSIYAPENFEGTYVAASDIFQAGLMFYQLWTGLEPFGGRPHQGQNESEDDFSKRVMEDAKIQRLNWHYVPSTKIRDIAPSSRLDAILSKCLAYTPQARYKDADQVLADIQTSNINLAQHAFETGDLGFAEETAQTAISETNKERDKVEILHLLGDISFAKKDYPQAKDRYSEAYKLEDLCGAYNLQKPRKRLLLLRLSECYDLLGQKGMSNMYKRKAEALA